MTHTIESGFPYVRKGKKKDGTPTERDVGEDPFDAAVGLAAMLKVVRNPAQADINNMADPKVEGWILGLKKISTPSQPER